MDNYKVLFQVFLVKVSKPHKIFISRDVVHSCVRRFSFVIFSEKTRELVSLKKKSSSSLSLKKVSDENEMLATANLADESSKPVLLDVAVKCNRKESF